MSIKRGNNYSIEALGALVKSLSSAEKRHISMFSKTFRSSARDTQFFKLYQKLLDSEFKHSNDLKKSKLSTLKTRLFENIMRSLRLFYHQKSIEVKINGHLSDIEILYRLQLPQQSYYVLNQSYEDVISYEMFAIWLQLLMWEKKLVGFIGKPKRNIEQIATEEQIVLKKISELVVLETIYNRMKAIKYQFGQMKSVGHDKLKAELNQLTKSIMYEKCSSDKARFYYNFTHVLFNWLNSNPEEAYKYSNKLISSNIEKVLPSEYFEAILEHSTSCILLGKLYEALEVLKYADKFFEKYKTNFGSQLKTKLFLYNSGYKLVIYTYMGDRQRLSKAITFLESELANHELHIPLDARQVLNTNLMNAYLCIGNFEKVNELWNLLFTKDSKLVRRNIYITLRLFKLFILLNEKMYDIIPSFALSAYRYYCQQSDVEEYKLEVSLCKFFTKEFNWSNTSLKRNILSTAKTILKDNFLTKCPFEHYLIYYIWIDSIEKEIYFYEAAAIWYIKYKSSATVVD